jgi:hypothetical protein
MKTNLDELSKEQLEQMFQREQDLYRLRLVRINDNINDYLKYQYLFIKCLNDTNLDIPLRKECIDVFSSLYRISSNKDLQGNATIPIMKNIIEIINLSDICILVSICNDNYNFEIDINSNDNMCYYVQVTKKQFKRK